MPEESGTNVVDVYINYLRRKLAMAHPDGLSSAAVIETVRGQGYRLHDGKRGAAGVGAETLLAKGA